MVDNEVLARVMCATADRKVRKLEHELLAAEVEKYLLKAIGAEGETYVGFGEVSAYDVFGNALGNLYWAEIDLTTEGGLRVTDEGGSVTCTDLTLLNDPTLELILAQLKRN